MKKILKKVAEAMKLRLESKKAEAVEIELRVRDEMLEHARRLVALGVKASMRENVQEFMDTFGQYQHLPLNPLSPPLAERKLRAQLVLEEALEFCAAVGLSVIHKGDVAPDRVAKQLLLDCAFTQYNHEATLDALIDLDYVGLQGSAIALGFTEAKTLQAHAEIHRSNMSKLWTEDQLEQAKKDHPGCEVENYGNGLYRLKYRGKVIKSPTYSPADLTEIV